MDSNVLYATSVHDIFLLYLHRIIQVDLKFPPKPIVSSAAKDLISQVLHLFCALRIFCEALSIIFFSRYFIHFCLNFFSLTDAGQGFLSKASIAQTP
jgi:hypothetical protein